MYYIKSPNLLYKMNKCNNCLKYNNDLNTELCKICIYDKNTLSYFCKFCKKTHTKFLFCHKCKKCKNQSKCENLYHCNRCDKLIDNRKFNWIQSIKKHLGFLNKFCICGKYFTTENKFDNLNISNDFYRLRILSVNLLSLLNDIE